MIILDLLAVWPVNSEARTKQGAFAEEDSPAELRAKVLPRLPIPEGSGAGPTRWSWNSAPRGAGQD